MFPSASSCKRAFTLIELLTVIAIIGILAAIIIPVVGKVRDSARRSQCSSNIRQIATGMLLFATENKNRFPPVIHSENGVVTIWSYNLARSKLLPTRFTGWYCPTHAQNDPTIEPKTVQPHATVYPRSYTLCNTLVPIVNGARNERASANLLSFPNPSRTLMLTEWHSSGNELNSYTSSVAGRDLITGAQRITSSKHADGARNYAFVDGHVAYLSLTEAGKPELWMEQ